MEILRNGNSQLGDVIRSDAKCLLECTRSSNFPIYFNSREREITGMQFQFPGIPWKSVLLMKSHKFFNVILKNYTKICNNVFEEKIMLQLILLLSMQHGSFYVAHFSYHLEVFEIKTDAN